MGAGSRCYMVPFAALLLCAASLRAQDGVPSLAPSPSPLGHSSAASLLSQGSEPIEAPPGQPPLVVEPVPCPSGPSFYFRADWLWTSHAGTWSDTRNFIDGPDAASFDNLPSPTGDNGYRFRGGVRLGNWILEGVYSHFGDWNSSLNQNVNGVAFNAGAHAGDWTGENSINANTFFAPIVNAASLPPPINTVSDQSGLGPSSAFATDPKPALMAHSHTEFYMTEANIKGADYIFPQFGRGLRLGLGYVNANLNNDTWVALSGTFRASNVSGTTISLPNTALTAPTGGDLTLYSGGGAGFTDGTSNGGTGTPSQLLFTHNANVKNSLNGVQAILDADLLDYQRIEIGATMQVGMFDNFAQGTIVETYEETNLDLSDYYRKYTASCHHLAFLGGVGLNAGYHVTDEISLCVGYDVVLLSNLALGPQQINGVSNGWYHVQTNGSAVLQSVHTGLEIAF